MPDEDEQESPNKPLSFKLILSIIIGIIVIALIWYGYYWINSTNEKVTQAEAVIQKAADYDMLTERIEDETRRCQQFISQEQGEFGEFEYCKRFINWTTSANN